MFLCSSRVALSQSLLHAFMSMNFTFVWLIMNLFFDLNLQEFWDWSWDEMASNDLPSMIELVYKITRTQIYYIGHSQVPLFFLMNSSV